MITHEWNSLNGGSTELHLAPGSYELGGTATTSAALVVHTPAGPIRRSYPTGRAGVYVEHQDPPTETLTPLPPAFVLDAPGLVRLTWTRGKITLSTVN